MTIRSTAVQTIGLGEEHVLPQRRLLLDASDLVHEVDDLHDADRRGGVIDVGVGHHLFQRVERILVLGGGQVDLCGLARMRLDEASACSKAATTAPQIFGLASWNFLVAIRTPLVWRVPSAS